MQRGCGACALLHHVIQNGMFFATIGDCMKCICVCTWCFRKECAPFREVRFDRIECVRLDIRARWRLFHFDVFEQCAWSDAVRNEAKRSEL